MRSIKAKILVSMVLTLAISLILVGGASCILSYRGTQSTLEASMKEMAVVATRPPTCPSCQTGAEIMIVISPVTEEINGSET